MPLALISLEISTGLTPTNEKTHQRSERGRTFELLWIMESLTPFTLIHKSYMHIMFEVSFEALRISLHVNAQVD
jgi:hypothetical protein